MSKLQTKIQAARRQGWGVMRIGKYDSFHIPNGYYVFDQFGILENFQGPFTKRQAVNLAYHYSLGR